MAVNAGRCSRSLQARTQRIPGTPRAEPQSFMSDDLLKHRAPLLQKCDPRFAKEAAKSVAVDVRCPGQARRAAPRWQSLGDWHRQLAVSPGGRRLRPSHLAPCKRWPPPVGSATPEPPADRLRCSEAPPSPRPDSMQTSPSRRVGPGRPGPRLQSPLAEGSLAPSLPAYPQIPRLPPHDSPHIRPFGRRLPCGRRQPRWSSLPPALGEAVAVLSQGVLRARWHCETLHLSMNPESEHKSEDDVAASMGGQQSSEHTVGPAPQGDVTVQAAPTAFAMSSTDEADSQRFDSAVAEESVSLSGVSGQVLTPRRRLEVTLRGTFRLGLGAKQLAEVDEAPDEVGDGADAAKAETLDPLRDTPLREQMGFGKHEVGAVPSGRSSVPAVRESCSAPPLLGVGVDEGIQLADLESGVERHVRKILERGLRGEPSRAASCEPGVERCLSPTPAGRSASRSSGLTDGLQSSAEERSTLQVSVRLCRSRCGSSSAVLELVLDHGDECLRAGGGCRCRPSLADAEVQLLAHFARHSLLRLHAAQPAVRVLLEPLPDAEDAEER